MFTRVLRHFQLVHIGKAWFIFQVSQKRHRRFAHDFTGGALPRIKQVSCRTASMRLGCLARRLNYLGNDIPAPSRDFNPSVKTIEGFTLDFTDGATHVCDELLLCI